MPSLQRASTTRVRTEPVGGELKRWPGAGGGPGLRGTCSSLRRALADEPRRYKLAVGVRSRSTSTPTHSWDCRAGRRARSCLSIRRTTKSRQLRCARTSGCEMRCPGSWPQPAPCSATACSRSPARPVIRDVAGRLAPSTRFARTWALRSVESLFMPSVWQRGGTCIVGQARLDEHAQLQL